MSITTFTEEKSKKQSDFSRERCYLLLLYCENTNTETEEPTLFKYYVVKVFILFYFPLCVAQEQNVTIF